MTHYAQCFSIDRLRLEAHLGFGEAERAGLQPVEVSMRLYFSAAPSCASHDHAPFIDYAAVAQVMTDAVRQREYRLIEYMAGELFRQVRAYLDAHAGVEVRLWLRLTKCQAPVDGLQGGASYALSDLPPGATTVEP